jgi:hypothetical protein
LRPSVILDRGPGDTLYWTFGYFDATFAPGQAPFTAPNQPALMPVPWPKLVRITISLADPADPETEQTYQFVFQVPEGRAGSGVN